MSLTDEIFPFFHYVIAVDEYEEAKLSPFAGISSSLLEASWAFPFFCSLPTNILEPASDRASNLARRVSGAGYRIIVNSIAPLISNEIPWNYPFFVIVTSNDENANQVDSWNRRQRYPALHINDTRVEFTSSANVSLPILNEYCARTLGLVEEFQPSHLPSCDTHALDRSHATVANGFLVLGAQSVIAAMLPINAGLAAMFVSRFIFRLADYVPLAPKYFGRNLRCHEIFSDMQRLQVCSEVAFAAYRSGLLDDTQFQKVLVETTDSINRPSGDWYGILLRLIKEECSFPDQRARRWIYDSISRSDAIKYTHLGNPEHITVGNWPESTNAASYAT